MADRAEVTAGGETWLAVECAVLFVGLPLVMAFAVPSDWLWPMLFGVTGVALLLLARTPGFRWRELVGGRLLWGEIAAVALVTAAACGLLVWWLVPWQAFGLPRRSTELWLTILLLYPFLSALPQELVFRLLFFRRYGSLFATPQVGVAASAASFALAHLMFWNWVAVVMTFAGGLLFARAYLGRGRFLLALALHAVCGWILFTSGLGSFFYHGAVR